MYCNSRWIEAGHAARVQPRRNDEDLVQRHAPRAIQPVPDFGLESALLVYRVCRKAGHEEIRILNRALDGSRPVLPRQQLARVGPRVEAGLLQVPREPLGRGRVFPHVRDEYLRQRPGVEAKPPAVSGWKVPKPSISMVFPAPRPRITIRASSSVGKRFSHAAGLPRARTPRMPSGPGGKSPRPPRRRFPRHCRRLERIWCTTRSRPSAASAWVTPVRRAMRLAISGFFIPITMYQPRLRRLPARIPGRLFELFENT